MSLKCLEYLKLKNSNKCLIVEIRPMYCYLDSPTGPTYTDKWMDKSHWKELRHQLVLILKEYENEKDLHFVKSKVPKFKNGRTIRIAYMFRPVNPCWCSLGFLTPRSSTWKSDDDNIETLIDKGGESQTLLLSEDMLVISVIVNERMAEVESVLNQDLRIDKKLVKALDSNMECFVSISKYFSVPTATDETQRSSFTMKISKKPGGCEAGEETQRNRVSKESHTNVNSNSSRKESHCNVDPSNSSVEESHCNVDPSNTSIKENHCNINPSNSSTKQSPRSINPSISSSEESHRNVNPSNSTYVNESHNNSPVNMISRDESETESDYDDEKVFNEDESDTCMKYEFDTHDIFPSVKLKSTHSKKVCQKGSNESHGNVNSSISSSVNARYDNYQENTNSDNDYDIDSVRRYLNDNRLQESETEIKNMSLTEIENLNPIKYEMKTPDKNLGTNTENAMYETIIKEEFDDTGYENSSQVMNTEMETLNEHKEMIIENSISETGTKINEDFDKISPQNSVPVYCKGNLNKSLDKKARTKRRISLLFGESSPPSPVDASREPLGMLGGNVSPEIGRPDPITRKDSEQMLTIESFCKNVETVSVRRSKRTISHRPKNYTDWNSRDEVKRSEKTTEIDNCSQKDANKTKTITSKLRTIRNPIHMKANSPDHVKISDQKNKDDTEQYSKENYKNQKEMESKSCDNLDSTYTEELSGKAEYNNEETNYRDQIWNFNITTEDFNLEEEEKKGPNKCKSCKKKVKTLNEKCNNTVSITKSPEKILKRNKSRTRRKNFEKTVTQNSNIKKFLIIPKKPETEPVIEEAPENDPEVERKPGNNMTEESTPESNVTIEKVSKKKRNSKKKRRKVKNRSESSDTDTRIPRKKKRIQENTNKIPNVRNEESSEESQKVEDSHSINDDLFWKLMADAEKISNMVTDSDDEVHNKVDDNLETLMMSRKEIVKKPLSQTGKTSEEDCALLSEVEKCDILNNMKTSYKKLRNMTNNDLEKRLDQYIPYLEEVIRGTEDNERHEMFKNSKQELMNMQDCLIFGPFTNDQSLFLLDLLKKKLGHMDNLIGDIYELPMYRFRVLVPTVFTRIVMDNEKVSWREATRILTNLSLNRDVTRDSQSFD